MKTFAFLIVFGCVTAKVLTAQTTTTTTTTPAPPPFTVVCKSTNNAQLTLTQSVKIIAGKGKCDPKDPSAKGIYTLGQDCLTNSGTFIVEPIATLKDNKNVVTNGKEYEVSCTKSNIPVIVPVSSHLRVTGPTSNPVKEAFTFPNNQPLVMTLSTEVPNAANIGTATSLITTNLGTILYLTIVEKKGALKLTPISCVAGTAKAANTTIWNYAGKDACTYEGTIMKTKFQNPALSTQHVTYAKIVAFQFVDDPTGEITFTCRVEECTSGTDCPKDLTSCKPSVKTRRRRELTHSNVDDAKIHHLTARLRIREDFAVHDGSGSVHYALSGLLLAVLIQIIL